MSRLSDIFKDAIKKVIENAMKPKDRSNELNEPLVEEQKKTPQGRQYNYTKKLKTLIKDKLKAGNAMQEFGYMFRNSMNMNPTVASERQRESTRKPKQPKTPTQKPSMQSGSNGVLSAIHYDPATQALDVMFRQGGKTYFYPAVPASMVANIYGKGGGSYFIHNIHDPYTLNPGHVPQSGMESRYQKYRSQYMQKPAKTIQEARSEFNSMP